MDVDLSGFVQDVDVGVPDWGGSAGFEGEACVVLVRDAICQ